MLPTVLNHAGALPNNRHWSTVSRWLPGTYCRRHARTTGRDARGVARRGPGPAGDGCRQPGSPRDRQRQIHRRLQVEMRIGQLLGRDLCDPPLVRLDHVPRLTVASRPILGRREIVLGRRRQPLSPGARQQPSDDPTQRRQPPHPGESPGPIDGHGAHRAECGDRHDVQGDNHQPAPEFQSDVSQPGTKSTVWIQVAERELVRSFYAGRCRPFNGDADGNRSRAAKPATDGFRRFAEGVYL